MSLPAHAVRVEARVPFHDCDPLAVVWHGRYFEYLEAGRCELLRTSRLDVSDMQELGIHMVISEARCHYSAPMRYGDRIEVTAWFSQYSPLIKVSYDMRNLTSGRRCARAHTTVALTDKSGTLLGEIPSAILERLPK